MNKIALLLAATLPLAYSFARADAGSSADLRYCLDLPTDQQIAKCAGEISAGGKKKPYSKEEVDRILSERNASSAPASAGSLSSTPPAASGNPDKDPSPAEAGQKAAEPKGTEGNSN